MKQPNLFGNDLFNEPIKPPSRGVVSDNFIFPPFTILDAKQGAWQDRKRAWINMGIKGEVGRDGSSIHCPTLATSQEPLKDANYVSIFDPVLTELMYEWFCPESGQIVDPFAGGSVRGIVAASVGRNYWGCDLRDEQIEANELQAEHIGVKPKWICGDAFEKLDTAPDADFVFSCPPYGDLEKYSDLPADLSQMDWIDFCEAYRNIIKKAVDKLKNDRFACFVVGDFRDKTGFYRGFVHETVYDFEIAGARLYNEAVLATSVGSACMRVTKQFKAGRKMAKTHQNILVFCKGDWRKAAKAIGGVR